jgi:hypothetical protein
MRTLATPVTEPVEARVLLSQTSLVRYPQRAVHRSLALALCLVAASREARAQHGDGPLNQTDYALEARIVEPRTIEGTARVRWKHRSDVPATALEWHLYANAFAPGSLFLRTLSGGTHRGNAPGRGGSIEVHSIRLGSGEELLARSQLDFGDADRTRMRSELPAPIARDVETTITVRFTVRLPDAFSRSGCGDRFCFAAQWFPKLAVYERDGRWSTFALHAQSEFYADFGRYELSVDAPSSVTVFANGQSIGAPVFNSPGRSLYRFALGHGHDCAFGWSPRALTRLDSVTPSRWRDGDSPPGARPVSIRTVYTAPDAIVAARAVALIQRALPALERRFGPYPYSSLTVIVAPRDAQGIGGMEYPGLITIEGNPFVPSFIRSVEYITAHELAHQWFYGLLASDEHAEPALDEGLTEFATGLLFDELYGEPSFGHAFGLGVSFWAMQGAFSNLANDDGPILRSASDFRDFDSYANVVYRRTSAMFDLTRRRHPLALDRALAAYARAQRFRHPTSRDLLAALRAEPELAPTLETLVEPTLSRRSTLSSVLPPVARLNEQRNAAPVCSLFSLTARLSTAFAVVLRWLGP